MVDLLALRDKFSSSRRKQSSEFPGFDAEMKGKVGKLKLRLNNKLRLPSVVFLCIVFFAAGLFGSQLLSQNLSGDGLNSRKLESLDNEKEEKGFDFLTKGEGDDYEDSFTEIPFQVLSWYPRAVYFPEFASPAQCRAIIGMARSKLSPSTLALRPGETEESMKGIRTSSGMFIAASEDKTGILNIIEEKIANITTIPRSHYEAFNVLRYETGQKYDAHYDAFDPSEYGPVKSQRIATFLLYLSDVEKGGETMFPFENGMNTDGYYDYQKCVGLIVTPRQGDGLLFHSVLPNGTIDPTSLHGSCPVIKGEKWVATKWMRNQELHV